MLPIQTKNFALSKERFSQIVRQELVLKNRIIVFGTGAICCAIALLCAWGSTRGIGGQILEAWTPFLVIIGLWWAWFLWGMPWYSFANRLNRKGFNNRRFSFFEDHLVVETEDGVYLKAPYDHFPRIVLGKSYVMFQESMATFHMVPAEVFETEDDFENISRRLSTVSAA